MKKKLWIALLTGCFMCVATGVLAADKTPVKLIGSAILSGKVGSAPETGWGFIDAQDYVNFTGGVNGRKFEVILEDGQYDVPVSVSLFNRVVAAQPKNELFFHCGWQTGVLRAIAEKVSENHMVCIDGSMASNIFTDDVKEKYPYYFSCGVPYGEQCGMIFKYIKENLHKGKKKPKLAFIYIDATAGKDPIKKMKMYADRFGFDLVMVEPVTFTTTDFTPTLMKIRKAKADYVLFWSWSVPVSTRFLKTARPYLPKTKFFGLSYLAWEIFFATTGEAFDGVYMVSPYPRPSETENPLVATLLESVKKKERKIKIWDLYLQAWVMTLISDVSAKRADDAGNLTREGVRDAMENLKDWDAFGMYGGKTFDYSTHKFPRARMLKADFATKSLKPVTDWLVVDDYLK